MTDYQKAVDLLYNGNYTFVAVCGDKVYKSREKGIKTLLGLINDKIDLKNFSCADRVVGKGAAFVYILLNAKCLYSEIISIPAYEILTEHNIDITYKTIVERILNRTKTGHCPIESAVMNIDNSKDALSSIIKNLK